MFDRLPKEIVIREESPRDGFQDVRHFIPTETKVAIIDALVSCGLKRIAATSFVHPKRVPQMADAEAVMAGIRRVPGVTYSALVGNIKGLERAITAKADEVGVGASASNAFSLKNVNRSTKERLASIPEFLECAQAGGVRVESGMISMAFGCPFEGEISPEKVLENARALWQLGIRTICLADTIGIANPRQVYDLFSLLRRELPQARLGAHLHDTRGQGLANAVAALEAGCTVFDSSAAGIGGCPFVPGAAGNIATEDFVWMLEKIGIQTGIDLDKLIEVARLIAKEVREGAAGHLIRIQSRTGSTEESQTPT